MWRDLSNRVWGHFQHMGADMTFGFKGFGKVSGLFGNSGHGGGSFGGNHGGGLFGGNHGGGLFGGNHGGGHQGGGSHNSGHHNNNNDDDCDDSDTGTGGNTGGGNTGGGTVGTGWPEILADTSGITFTVDYDADGANDNYIPVGRASDLKTFEDYLAVARDKVLEDNPDVDPKEVIIKATITSRSGAETYYDFTGLEEGTPAEEEEEEDEDDTDCEDDDDRGHGGHGGHGGGSHGRHHDNDDNDDDDCDDDRNSGGHKGHADFFKSLFGGGKCFDTNHDDEDDQDDNDDDDGFDFC